MARNTSRNRMYSNDEITVFWRACECCHSTLCYTKLRAVFDPLKRPWVNINGAPTADILDIVEQCPTSALTFRWRNEAKNETEKSHKLFRGSVEQVFGTTASDQGSSSTGVNQTAQAVEPDQVIPSEAVKPTAMINIRPNGPLVVMGEFQLIDSYGEPLGNWKMVSLCRCAMSDNMPYCDGSHFKAGFSAK